MDSYFAKLMQEHLRGGVRLQLVGVNKQNAQEVADRLEKAGIAFTADTRSEGPSSA